MRMLLYWWKIIAELILLIRMMRRYLIAFVCLFLPILLFITLFVRNQFSADLFMDVSYMQHFLMNNAKKTTPSSSKVSSELFKNQSEIMNILPDSTNSGMAPHSGINSSRESRIYGLGSSSAHLTTLSSDSDNLSLSLPSKHGCLLPELDPWDRTIQSYIDANFRPFKDCKKINLPVETILSKEGLHIKISDANRTYLCQYRCLHYMTELEFNATEWTVLEEKRIKTSCEIIQTKCLCDNETVHVNVHAQISNISVDDKSNKRDATKPSVFVIIFDSVSNSNGLRSLAKTMQVLRYKYGAVNFSGLNKVGINSRPNAWALFTGLRIEELPAGTIHEHEIKSELPESCEKYVDDFAYVGHNFSSAGYRSVLIEDWLSGAFVWPKCQGFRANPATHNMKPYWQLLRPNDEIPQLLYDHCKSTYDVSFEYLQQFLKAYEKDVPKFGVAWISEMSHNYLNGLYQIDHSLAQFFIEYEAELENSFVFLMGDHGMRLSSIRKTKTGEYEDNNPFLTVSVPKNLRKNALLMENINYNSKNLVTHFDLYLTLMDIATVLPLSNFTNFEHFNWFGYMPKNRGSSLMRPIDPSERNCDSLDIPESFCNCKRNKTAVTLTDGLNDQSSITYKGAEILTTGLNQMLSEHNVQNNCSNMSLLSVDSAELIREEGKMFYSIIYSVLPSRGLFQGFVRVYDNNSFALISKTQNRLSVYGNESHCVNNEKLRPICYCKDLLNKLNN